MTPNSNSPSPLDRIGRRMPYRVPAGYFEQMEAGVRQALSQPAPRRRGRLVRWLTVGAVAAAAAVAAVVFVLRPAPSPADDWQAVQLAFDRLTTADQDYLLAVYADDPFLDADE